MIDRYAIDFDKTFGETRLLGVDPKMQRSNRDDRNSPTEQARDKDGVPKWTVTVSAKTKSFDNTKYENIPITISSQQRPFEAIPPGTLVTVEGMEMGIMPKDKGGFSVFYSAESIRPVQSPRVAGNQPARIASGQ